jgi:RNA polymerase sigma-70 factor, ECF subfamily
MTEPPSDPAILEAHLTGLLAAGARMEAATLVVQSYGPGILGYLGALLRDDEAARDVFSEFSEELWKALPRFEGRSAVRTWAYAIAYRCALRFRRARARRRTRPLRDSEISKIAASVTATTRSVSRTEVDRKLDVLRRTLDDEEQTLLILRLDRNMSWQATSHVFGPGEAASPEALRKRFQRLKERLRRAAKQSGWLGKA